jgi:hypothetical protein
MIERGIRSWEDERGVKREVDYADTDARARAGWDHLSDTPSLQELMVAIDELSFLPIDSDLLERLYEAQKKYMEAIEVPLAS